VKHVISLAAHFHQDIDHIRSYHLEPAVLGIELIAQDQPQARANSFIHRGLEGHRRQFGICASSI
jgi:hypothetical protein